MDEDRRRMYPDVQSDLGIKNLIEILRVNWARDNAGASVGALVDELRHVSADFNDIWMQRRVTGLASVLGRVRP